METIIGSGPGPGPTGSAQGLIKDGSTETFMADVIDASHDVPVIVDFWAPWCGPCKQLGPLLEKVVADAAGRVKLVKIDIDQNQQLAAQMRIQSIPAVYAFKDGRPVDGFMGALPESQIRTFVERLAGAPVASPIEEALEEAKAAIERGDAGTAGAIFEQVLQHEPDNPVATAGMAQVHLASGDTDTAQQIVDSIPINKRTDPFVAGTFSAIDLAKQTADSGDIEELKAKVAANDEDWQARHDLALALFARNRHREAADELLEIVRRNRGWNDDAARKQLVKFFEAWGPKHELTSEVRRQLSSLMFS